MNYHFSSTRARAAPLAHAWFVLVCLLFTAAIPGACERRTAQNPTPREPGALRIAVTVPPLEGLVRAAAPADARITVLMAPGHSEHGYEFTPQDLAELGRADLVVYVGLHLEPRVEEFLKAHPSTRRVDLCFAAATGIADGDEHDAHDHADGAHHHGAVDPHLWLDLGLVQRFAPQIERAVHIAAANAGLDAAGLPARARDLDAKLKSLDERYRTALAPFTGDAIVTHHNAWGRLADRYSLRVAAVVIEIESAEPTPGQIAASVAAIKAQRVKTLFVEPQFNPDAARRIAQAAGVGVGVLDPLGEGDYFGLMERNLQELVKGLGQ